MSTVSVIIPAYNASAFVSGAIRSVLDQSWQDFEVIVVDDGSRDHTAKAVQPYLADSRVRYVSQANAGAPVAKNTGVKVSRGEYVAFLDADDFLAPAALETMVAKVKELSAAFTIVGVSKLIGETRTYRPAVIPPGDPFLAILEDDFVTRSPFYPKKDFEAIGMYDEQLPTREDWDINIRMFASGKPFVVIDEPLYIYSRSEGSLMTGNRRRVLDCTEKVLRKHHRPLADAGNEQVSRIYAANMWELARRYFYELKDLRQCSRCAIESLRYDASMARLVHPVIHRVETAFGKQ